MRHCPQAPNYGAGPCFASLPGVRRRTLALTLDVAGSQWGPLARAVTFQCLIAPDTGTHGAAQAMSERARSVPAVFHGRRGTSTVRGSLPRQWMEASIPSVFVG